MTCRRTGGAPPGVVFHTFAGAAALALLFSTSVPGLAFFTALGASVALLVSGVVWVIRVTSYLLANRRSPARETPKSLLILPIGAVVVLLFLVASLPLRLRWALSQSAFDDVVEEMTPTGSPDEIVSFTVPDRVGLYRIAYAYRQGDAVIFYEATGILLDDAGFAYLPSGPFPELETANFEVPEFRHLSGAWYAWTASW